MLNSAFARRLTHHSIQIDVIEVKIRLKMFLEMSCFVQYSVGCTEGNHVSTKIEIYRFQVANVSVSYQKKCGLNKNNYFNLTKSSIQEQHFLWPLVITDNIYSNVMSNFELFCMV